MKRRLFYSFLTLALVFTTGLGALWGFHRARQSPSRGATGPGAAVSPSPAPSTTTPHPDTIRHLLRRASQANQPASRYDLQQQLESLPRNAITSVLREDFEAVATEDQESTRLSNPILRRALQDLLDYDPALAAELAKKHFTGLKRSHAFFTIIEQWGRRDPPAVLSLIAQLDFEDPSSNIHNATTSFLSEWASNDPAAALDAWLALPEPKLPDENSVAYSAECLARSAAATPASRPRALALLLSLEPTDARTSALGGILKSWVETAPLETVTDWLSDQSFDPGQTDALALAVASASVERDGEQAARWMMDTVSQAERAEAMGALARHWAWESPNECGQWLTGLSPSNERDWAIEGFLQKVGTLDPESGFLWSRLLQHPDRRKKQAWQLWSQWRQKAPRSARAFLPQLTGEERGWLAPAPGHRP
ncbi:MAG: hypothetical protein AAF514_04960 [Verrucomicrobiota bacterium]